VLITSSVVVIIVVFVSNLLLKYKILPTLKSSVKTSKFRVITMTVTRLPHDIPNITRRYVIYLRSKIHEPRSRVSLVPAIENKVKFRPRFHTASILFCVLEQDYFKVICIFFDVVMYCTTFSLPYIKLLPDTSVLSPYPDCRL
jgi:hypothetical protein